MDIQSQQVLTAIQRDVKDLARATEEVAKHLAALVGEIHKNLPAAKWAYQVCPLKDGMISVGPDRKEPALVLNAAGKDGWELVATVPGTPVTLIIMRRAVAG